MSRPTYTVHEMDTSVLTYFEVTSRRWEVRSSSTPNEAFCSFCSHYGARKIADALNAAPALRFVERLAAEGCQNFTSEWTCHKSGRIPFADYGADAMCDPCIARLALGGQ